MKHVLIALVMAMVLIPAGWATHERITEARIARIEKRLNENYRRDRVRAERTAYELKALDWYRRAHGSSIDRIDTTMERQWNILRNCVRYVDGTIGDGTGAEVPRRIAVILRPGPEDVLIQRYCSRFIDEQADWIPR